MPAARHTIGGPATVRGIGLHSGRQTAVTLKPAPPGAGITFQRIDLKDHPTVAARLDAVSSTNHRTTLGDGDACVHTVEHLMAAVAAHAIDDLLIEIDGAEPPAGDGSAAPYFDAIQQAGTAEQNGEPTSFTLQAPFTVREGDARYVAAPADQLRLTVTIDWDHPAIGRQSGCYDVTAERFGEELSRARTFGFARDAEALRADGLARGVSPENCIVLSDAAPLAALRWPDEFVRHKAVDLIGDLALLGGRCRAEIVAFRPTHQGNVALARAIRRAASTSAPAVMGIDRILGVIPHRYPMLLVDRIVEIEEGKRIVGIKNVTINEPFFQGHFPGHPIMPGVLIVEAMAQVGGMLLLGAVDDPQSKVVYFMSIDGVKFRRPVVPGDQLRFELEMLQFRGKTCRMRGVGYVDGRPVAEAEMMAGIVDR